MNKVIHREANAWGRTSIIILAGGFGIVMVTVLDNNKNVAVVHDLVVHESRRKKGLGTKLLNEALNESVNMGATTIRLSVDPDSWTADWYYNRGFVPKECVEYEGHECLVMEQDNTQ